MGLFSRVKTLFESNANAALDSMEDPEKMADQAIIDLQKGVQDAIRGLGLAKAAHNKNVNSLTTAKKESASWEEKAKSALIAGREDLATKALANKADADHLVNNLTTATAQSQVQVDKLTANVKTINDRVADTKVKRDQLVANARMAKANEVTAKAFSETNVDGVLATFDRMEDRVNSTQATADAINDISSTFSNDEHEFDELLKESSATSDMERLKASMGL